MQNPEGVKYIIKISGKSNKNPEGVQESATLNITYTLLLYCSIAVLLASPVNYHVIYHQIKI